MSVDPRGGGGALLLKWFLICCHPCFLFECVWGLRGVCLGPKNSGSCTLRVFFSVAVRYLAGVIVVVAVGGRVVPSVLGVMAADSHHEKLFAELVASALRQKMDDDWTEWQLPEPSSTLARVSELEAAVVEIRGDVADIKSHIVLMAQALGVLPAKHPIILAPMQPQVSLYAGNRTADLLTGSNGTVITTKFDSRELETYWKE